MTTEQKYILAIDQGTTSSRTIIFNHDAEIVAVAQQEFQQLYPNPGWVEHDPAEIWSSQKATIAEAMQKAKIDKSRVAAVGITNQRETTLIWDRDTGKPIHNAIVWQDRRTADFCSQLKKDQHEDMIREKTGLCLDPYFSGTKLRWLLDNVEGAQQRAKDGKLCFGTIDSWLLWQLTGRKVHATDLSNASRTLLCNIKSGNWDPDLLQLLDIPEAMLPEIRSCSEVYGTVNTIPELSGIPVAAMAGDQQAALFGQACFEPGMVKNTYGTGCFTLMNTGEKPIPSQNNLLTTVAWRIGNHTEYALEGSVFIGGAVVQWLRDELKLVQDAEELNKLAAMVDDAGGTYLVPAFTGLGAPHWDPYARGTIIGLTRGTNRAQLCRAALDSIAYQSADLIQIMEKDSGIKLRELRVDGGAARSNLLLQFQADLLQTPVIRPQCIETTALGAAYLAGLAVGFWDDRERISKNWTSDLTFKPTRSPQQISEWHAGWKKAVKRSLDWLKPED